MHPSIDRLAVLILVAAPSLCGAANAGDSSATIADRLVNSLPKPWTIVERRSEALPEGHYWGMDYNGVRGEEILLQGSTDVHIAWQDSTGKWHRDAVGKEALKLYVMPLSYRESLLRYFIAKRPVTARLLVETSTSRVYAYPTTRIFDKEAVDLAIKHGKAIRWPDSPELTGLLSWSTWMSDIQVALRRQ